MTQVSSLNDDLLLIIFSNLVKADLETAMLVSKEWRNVGLKMKVPEICNDYLAKEDVITMQACDGDIEVLATNKIKCQVCGVGDVKLRNAKLPMSVYGLNRIT